MTKNFFHPSLLLLFLGPGSEIRDPGWIKIKIRDKHPGSATLAIRLRKLSEYRTNKATGLQLLDHKSNIGLPIVR
jgi:hypothetical protein